MSSYTSIYFQQAALVLNASRRFRYTLDLKKEEEKKELIAKIRTHAQVIRVPAFVKFSLDFLSIVIH